MNPFDASFCTLMMYTMTSASVQLYFWKMTAEVAHGLITPGKNTKKRRVQLQSRDGSRCRRWDDHQLRGHKVIGSPEMIEKILSITVGYPVDPV
jgi:hypothetical protein